MINTNYIGSIVKILEKPIQTVFNDKISVTEFRVQLPQIRNTRIVKVVFWGKLARDVKTYYKVNDYIMIEGYLSLQNTAKVNSNSINQNSKKVQITVLKVYPFLFNSDRSIS
jgi:single-stranded DNA-binding protein